MDTWVSEGLSTTGITSLAELAPLALDTPFTSSLLLEAARVTAVAEVDGAMVGEVELDLGGVATVGPLAEFLRLVEGNGPRNSLRFIFSVLWVEG
mgnify:CR=1 FL=1